MSINLMSRICIHLMLYLVSDENDDYDRNHDEGDHDDDMEAGLVAVE